MDALHHAILLNNHGVHQLDCGAIDDALYSLQCAVAAVKVAIAMTASTVPDELASGDQPPTTTTTATSTTTTAHSRFPPKNHTDNNDCCRNETASSSFHQESKPSAPTNSPSAQSRDQIASTPALALPSPPSRCIFLDDLSTEIGYIYNRPLLIPTNINIRNMEHLNAVVVTSSIYIIFNFALACHVVAKHTGRDTYFLRAMRLYELTLKVLDAASHQQLQNSSSMTPCQTKEMYAVLECLTLNNLAQMHFEMCDYELSQFYMDSMYEIVLTVQNIDAYLEEHEIEDLMLNLVYSKAPTVAKAA